MNRRIQVLTALAWLLGTSVPTPASALYTTPTWDRGLVFDLLQWDPDHHLGGLAEARLAMVSQGYVPVFYTQTEPGDSSGALRVLQELQEPYGAFAIDTHGTRENYGLRAGLPAIEFYDSGDVLLEAVQAVFRSGLANSSEIDGGFFTVEGVDSLGNPDSTSFYAMLLDTLGLEHLSQPRDAIIHTIVCFGALQYGNWTTSGTGTMVGYDEICYAGPGSADSRAFWRNLHGFSGRANRTVTQASSGTGLAVFPEAGGDSLVLAPWIIAVQPPQQSPAFTIMSVEASYAEFDTEMHTSESDADAAIGLSEHLRFFDHDGDDSPHWEQSASVSWLSWKMYPQLEGTGTVTIFGGRLRSAGGIPMNSGLTDSTLHYLVPRDTLKYTYRVLTGDPAIALDHVSATTGAGGDTIRFTTAWEQYADSFRVERVAGPTGPDLPKIAATGGPGFYELLDPYGDASSRYQIVEEQSGYRPDLRYDIFDAGPAISIDPSDPATPGLDSVAAFLEATTGADSTDYEEFLETIGVESGPLYVLIAPDSIATSLWYYRTIWQNRNVTTSVIPMSEMAAHGGLDSYISWAYDQGTRYVLLVGDANDAEWWDDETKWINGWHWPLIGEGGPHHPSQPDHNLIPTTYWADSDSPHVAMSFYTPYYASDLPYADVDGNGTPDMRIGRLPADSRADVFAYTFKLASYLGHTPASNPDNVLMTYARDNGGMIGRFVAEDADSVAAAFLPSANLDRVTDTQATQWEFWQRRAIADSVAATSPDRMFWISSGAQRDIYGNYWRLDQGWSMDSLAVPSPAGRFFVSLGFSCGMGNFDQTENYLTCNTNTNPATCSVPVRPIPERLLLSTEKGAIAVIGPTRGTRQQGNVLFAKEMVRQLAGAGRDLGTAFMVAQATCLVKYPDQAKLFRSYVLLGDPLLGGPILTAVATDAPRVKPGLVRARPNPFNPSTTLGVRLAEAGRAELRVYDVRGRVVRTLLRGERLPAGLTPVKWDGRTDQGTNVASGVYIAKLTAAGGSFHQKLVLLK